MPQFREHFGFTEAEFTQLLAKAGRLELLPRVRDHYNGYSFGGKRPVEIYNPWSIINFLSQPVPELMNF